MLCWDAFDREKKLNSKKIWALCASELSKLLKCDRICGIFVYGRYLSYLSIFISIYKYDKSKIMIILWYSLINIQIKIIKYIYSWKPFKEPATPKPNITLNKFQVSYCLANHYLCPSNQSSVIFSESRLEAWQTTLKHAFRKRWSCIFSAILLRKAPPTAIKILAPTWKCLKSRS